MRRLWLTAVLAVPFFLLAFASPGSANPCQNCGHGFGCGDLCFRIFPHMFQEGPLFNYGPYYGYYPFTPYGPWDPYLRYNPYFYGDPYADFDNKRVMPHAEPDHSGRYGPNLNLHRPGFPMLALPHPALSHPGLFHTHGCLTCGFWHASWLHGGWFRGHAWLAGGFHTFHKPACTTCGAIAVAQPIEPTGDVLTRYTGFGTPSQSAIYYPPTATLDPALDVLPATGQ